MLDARICLLMALVAAGPASASSNNNNFPENKAAQKWYLSGADYVKNQQRRTQGDETLATHAKNVILFIGDGMSQATVTASRIYQGQLAGMPGEENLLSFENFPAVALSKTYAVDRQVADSASTATAMLSGVKVKFYTLGVDESAAIDKCGKGRLKSLLEIAEEKGLATGVVSTARLTHATPAATYAHVAFRDFEADAKGCKDVAQQLIEFPYGDGLEVALGGGLDMFMPTSVGGKRIDDRDLTKEWLQTFDDSLFVNNSMQLNAVAKDAKHVLGLFSKDHMSFTEHRDESAKGEPSLTAMTEKAIEILSNSDKGYFLMVESGRIDHGHHAGMAKLALEETVEFSNAIARTLELVGDDTLIIVTADHSHTMTMSGYPPRGENILGFAGKDTSGKPYTTLNYANGGGYQEIRPDLNNVDTTADGYRQETAFPLKIETHGGEDVAIYAKGPGSQWVNGVMEQNVIFHIMRTALFGQ